MSVEEASVVEPFTSIVTDEEIESRALCHALTLADGFSLLFARCNQADHRRDLIEQIKARLPNMNIQLIEFREPVTHLLDELRTRIDSPLPDAIFVLGLEYSLPRSSDAHSSSLIANLNAARNSFPEALPFPLVLWVPEYIVTAIARGAPDFFSIRSGLYSFAAALKDSMSTVRSVMDGDWVGVQNLTLTEKKERVESIRSMLADYESIPAEKRDLSTEASLHYRLGSLLYAVGSSDDAEEESLTSLRIAEELGDRAAIARSLHQIGNTLRDRGRYAAALEHYQRSIAILEELGDRKSLARTLYQIGVIYMDRDQHKKALKQFYRSLKTAENTGDRSVIARSLHQIGIIHQIRGQHEAALEHFSRSVKIAKELGDSVVVGISLHSVGTIYEQRGEYEAAMEQYQLFLAISEKVGDRRGTADSLYHIGKIHALRGQYSEGFQSLCRALATFAELGSTDTRTQATLRKLRANWGEVNFDHAWQLEHGEPVPDRMK